jgi:hypothetical protein
MSPLSRVKSGDLLWVQEAFARLKAADCAMMRDGWRQYRDGRGEAGPAPDNSFGRIKWFQAVHMPRWASRIALTVEDLRIEPLQSMTKNDAISEGYASRLRFWASPIDQYRKHWDAIRGTEGERWVDNPAVVALKFSRCEVPSPTSVCRTAP